MVKPRSTVPIEVYLEVGTKRTFAGAIEWPGWCRSGRDETAALEALLEYAPRYAQAIEGVRPVFHPPRSAAGLRVVEWLRGNATTDFGAPGIAPAADGRPLSTAEGRRLAAILRASWRTFDESVRRATGKTLRVGPRGGGRMLTAIVRHVAESEAGYLAAAGWKAEDPENPESRRDAILAAVAAGSRGEIAARGPRGGDPLDRPVLRAAGSLARPRPRLGARPEGPVGT
jgi:hypothetical protein